MKKYFQNKKPLLAFSGGSDSLYLLYKLIENNIDFMTVSCIGPNTCEGDIEIIKKAEEFFNIHIEKINYNPLDNKDFVINTKDRCYYCKKSMFQAISDYFKTTDCNMIIDGTNGDDKNSFRPGKVALKEYNIFSPLEELNINKKEIMAYLENKELKTTGSNSCYATRIPYKEEITKEKLDFIKKSEEFILNLGISSVRCVKINNLIKIDVNYDEAHIILEHRDKIVDFFPKNMYITLDLEGFYSGKGDKKKELGKQN